MHYQSLVKIIMNTKFNEKDCLKKCTFVLSLVPIIVWAVFLLCGCSDKEVIIREGQPAPAFVLTDITGKTIRVPEDVKGKIVAIRFWADWCKACVAEMPEIDRVYKKYANSDFLILAVNVGQDRSTVEKFVKGYNISYPVLIDVGREVTKRYGIAGIPVTYFLDRNGIIRRKILGEIDGVAFEKIVLEQLKEKEPEDKK